MSFQAVPLCAKFDVWESPDVDRRALVKWRVDALFIPGAAAIDFSLPARFLYRRNMRIRIMSFGIFRSKPIQGKKSLK